MSAPHFPPPPAWASEFSTVGVTGTNGKTSTTRWIAAALAAANRGPVARVTTVGSFVGDEALPVEESYEGFLETLRTCRSRGGSLAALEVTSEALAVGFAQAWPIHVGVFTNLSHDHLDAHRTAEHYLASKAQLFLHLPRGGAAVLNAFDEASLLLREVLPEGVRLVSYGVPSRSVRDDARPAS
ncbi:MAG TPA: Mur ligase family protein, partial [Polyangiaceae bacterium]